MNISALGLRLIEFIVVVLLFLGFLLMNALISDYLSYFDWPPYVIWVIAFSVTLLIGHLCFKFLRRFIPEDEA